MRFNLKLLHQGLILILLPIAFEMAFIPYLGNLLNNADRDLTKETHSLALIDHANHLIFLFGQATLAARLYRTFSNQMAMERYQEQITEIKANLADFAILCQNSPEETGRLAKVQAAARQTLDTLRQTVEQDRVDAAIISEIESQANKLAKELREFIEFERFKETIRPNFQIQSRQSVMKVLTFGVAANLLLGLALAVYFNKATVARLKILMDNTRRLAKKEDLLPRIGGKDEVGALDLVFHIMAESLDDASRKNQELMKTVGQDLRKPLTTIQLSLNALSDGVFGDLTERAQKEISISEFNTARLINLISDLTDIEKLDSGKLDIELCQADLNQILEASVGVVSSYASRKQIALIVEPTEACIMADRNRLVQVLVNLLSNAVKFSPKGSTVKLAAERVANQIEVRVTDQGRGVPEEFRETIFERFKQVQKEDAKTDQGSGLGLAICKAIINGHNGIIGVTASAGSGSTFWFRIPAETGNGECHEIKVENNAE